MKARGACIGLITCAAIVAGCGGGDDAGDEDTAVPKKQTLAQRHAEIERDPYELRCGDMKDKVASADITRTRPSGAGQRRDIRRPDPAAGGAEHLLRDDPALQGQAGLLPARPRRHRRVRSGSGVAIPAPPDVFAAAGGSA